MNKGYTCVFVALIDNASTILHTFPLILPLAAQHNFVEVNNTSLNLYYAGKIM